MRQPTLDLPCGAGAVWCTGLREACPSGHISGSDTGLPWETEDPFREDVALHLTCAGVDRAAAGVAPDALPGRRGVGGHPRFVGPEVPQRLPPDRDKC